MKTVSIMLKASLLAVCLFIAGQVYSQKKLETGIGVGVPEYTNLKIRYGRNFQAGVCVHYWYWTAGGIFGSYTSWSLAAEAYFHFAGKSEYITQRPYYLLLGAGYYHIDYLVDLPHEEYSTGFYPRLGRTFSLSEKMGINVDLGVFLPFTAQEGYKPYKFRLLYSGNISYFIRL